MHYTTVTTLRLKQTLWGMQLLLHWHLFVTKKSSEEPDPVSSKDNRFCSGTFLGTRNGMKWEFQVRLSTGPFFGDSTFPSKSSMILHLKRHKKWKLHQDDWFFRERKKKIRRPSSWHFRNANPWQHPKNTLKSKKGAVSQYSAPGKTFLETIHLLDGKWCNVNLSK